MTHQSPEVIIVGMGPAGPDLMTKQAFDFLNGTAKKLLRTEQHLAAQPWMEAGASSLDYMYAQTPTFEELYLHMADHVVQEADRHGRIVYAVPGSPLILERSVELILANKDVRTRIVSGLSFLDLAYERLRIDPVKEHLSLVEADYFRSNYSAVTSPVLIGQCWNKEMLSDIKLSLLERDDPDGTLARSQAVILHHLGHGDEKIVYTKVEDLDRTTDVDHLSCVYLPFAGFTSYPDELLRLTGILRRECPWDREQTHGSLSRHLLEETYEVLEAISDMETGYDCHTGEYSVTQKITDSAMREAELVEVKKDCDNEADHLCEELGDLLVQIFFHATIADEENLFNISDVVTTTCKKLIGRHPQIFKDDNFELTPFLSSILGQVRSENVHAEADLAFKNPSSAQQMENNWERIKKTEKQRESIFDGIPKALPALLYVTKLERKLRSIDASFVLDRDNEEKLKTLFFEFLSGDPQRVGDLLLTVTRHAASMGLDAEELTRRSAEELELHAKDTEKRKQTIAEQGEG